MLYTCDQPGRTPRGIYLRTAPLPWGPWSIPTRIFDPAEHYCHIMHFLVGCSSGTNPFEEEKRRIKPPIDPRDLPAAFRESGGEYAPFLLPGRYARPAANGRTALYYLLSTWNPYQVVLMKADVDLTP